MVHRKNDFSGNPGLSLGKTRIKNGRECLKSWRPIFMALIIKEK
jgi:hypothetical protein